MMFVHRKSGDWLEFFGLVSVLVATSWQFFLADWFNQQPLEWQHSIQEEVNLALLDTASDLNIYVDIAPGQRPEASREFLGERIERARAKVVSEGINRRGWMREGQYPVINTINGALYLLGALLFTIGKYINIKNG